MPVFADFRDRLMPGAFFRYCLTGPKAYFSRELMRVLRLTDTGIVVEAVYYKPARVVGETPVPETLTSCGHQWPLRWTDALSYFHAGKSASLELSYNQLLPEDHAARLNDEYAAICARLKQLVVPYSQVAKLDAAAYAAHKGERQPLRDRRDAIQRELTSRLPES